MASIGELERKAGVTDRAAFWSSFAKITGTREHDGKVISLGFEAGVEQLRWMADQRSAKAEGR